MRQFQSLLYIILLNPAYDLIKVDPFRGKVRLTSVFRLYTLVFLKMGQGQAFRQYYAGTLKFDTSLYDILKLPHIAWKRILTQDFHCVSRNLFYVLAKLMGEFFK